MRLSSRNIRSLLVALMYLAPSLVIFIAFVFVPLGRTIELSLFNTRVTGVPTTFAGLDHYSELLSSDAFRTGMFATLIFALYTVPIGIALGLVLAVLLNQRLRGISVFRTLTSSTIAVSAAVGSLIWLLLFNPSLGLLNYVLSLAGIRGPEWLIQPTTAIIAVSLTTVWLMLGTNVIVLLAGLQGVPEELYEAARIDGARGLRLFGSITVPMVSPSLFFLLVVDTIAVLQAFTQIHVMTRGGPVDTTRVLVYSIYLDAFQNFQFGFASAQAVILFGLVLALTIVQFRFIERRVHYQ
ncbi:MAG TPA: sugar ABC transporter permease [Candidatus Limnocylindria bacterium]|nr:sugar ABC transporter permease [Candidatus Limnocylindria bacterium]